jgi:hypothetical protein
MARFSFSKEEILAGTVVPADWYPVEIVKVDEKPMKVDDGSINFFVSVKILAGEYANVPVYSYVANSKAMGFAKNLMAAILGIAPSELKADEDLDLSTATAAGKQVDCYIVMGEYEGRANNKLQDWALLGTMSGGK